ncbi:DUF3549 family protein [Paraglaciecola aquimarina]|uniref:DUF3549 family protein n=1 Tax=Paraglaciecola algarum TaxID=3050085 RepID=A0ABS9D9P4_9ALTE|nr:DUF3549 family protein [Paraglaciecola sp. G1-23]MCF2948356.1 DUF3549 family protein [Paraglaciecola sp. G1-23]
MNNIDTISEFLLHAGTDYRIFDMARGIRVINSQDFLDIENGTVPAPYPRQQHIWMGVLFFNKQASKEQYIWFVKLPIDEQGLVIAAGRRQFLQIVIEALGQELDKNNNPNNQLPENPFTFVPNQQQLADFNSACRFELDVPYSEHLAKVINYLKSPVKLAWQDVPVQGIADFCRTSNEPENTDLFVKQFNYIAPELQNALAISLENNQPNSTISSFLIDWYNGGETDIQRLTLVLRAISQATDTESVQGLILQILNSEIGQDAHILMLIAARHWQYLKNDKVLELYIELLANSEPNTFIGLFSDLVQIPSIRPSMLSILRWPEKSTSLTQAIGQLFGQTN